MYAKNAFQLGEMDLTITLLKEFQVPEYLIKIIANYFSLRKLVYDTNVSRVEENKELYQDSIPGSPSQPITLSLNQRASHATIFAQFGYIDSS